MHANPSAGRDGGANTLARLTHVPEQERVVPWRRGLEEAPGFARIGVAAAHQDGGSRLAHSEFSREFARDANVKRCNRP
jgi:hypothetical protein